MTHFDCFFYFHTHTRLFKTPVDKYNKAIKMNELVIRRKPTVQTFGHLTGCLKYASAQFR